MGEFKKIETQEELDNILKERLDRERKKYEEKVKNYENLELEKNKLIEELNLFKNTKEKNNEDIEKLNNTITELTQKVSGYELKDLKSSIALNLGIPYKLHDRLKGNTKEEIEEDARLLSELIKTKETMPLKSVESINAKENSKSEYKNLLESLNLKGE